MPILNPLPPDDSTPETRAWEDWAGTVQQGDRVETAGRLATVTVVADEFLWVRLDGREDHEPFEWENVGPVRKSGDPDCGDNSCRYASHRGGMRTNGGCRCDNCPVCGMAIHPRFPHRKHRVHCTQPEWIPEHHRKQET